MATGDFWGRIINGPGWNNNTVQDNLGATLLNGSEDDWSNFFRNVGWGAGTSPGAMYQTVSPFAYQSYAKNAAKNLPAQFYANVFANLYNNSASSAPGTDLFGSEGLKAFLPQWASGTAPTANQDLPGARNQFNQAIGNMSNAWNQYTEQETNYNNATATWNNVQTNIGAAINNFNSGLSTSANPFSTMGPAVTNLSTSALALQPYMEQLANLGLATKTQVGTRYAVTTGTTASGGYGAATLVPVYKYTLAPNAFNAANVIGKLPQLKPIIDALSEGAVGSTDWMAYSGTNDPKYRLAYAALYGNTDNYYDPAVNEAGAIANAMHTGGNASTQYQKMFVQMMLNALGSGWGGAFQNAYIQDLQRKLNDYSQVYSGSNQNFFQWLANMYNGYLR